MERGVWMVLEREHHKARASRGSACVGCKEAASLLDTTRWMREGRVEGRAGHVVIKFWFIAPSIHTYMHTYIAYIHTYIHAYIHTHIHT